MNPVPIGPTLEDSTDLTIVVDLSGPAVPNVLSPVSASLINDNSYRKRITKFIDGLKPTREPAQPRHGLIDVAFGSMQAMQDTISQLRLATYSPDAKIEIPRNACGFFEFWRAEELINLGRERTAQAFARSGR